MAKIKTPSRVVAATPLQPAPLTADETRWLSCWRHTDDRRRSYLLALAEIQSAKYPRRAARHLVLIAGARDENR